MPEQNSLLQKYEQDQPHNAKMNGLFIEEQTKLAGHGWNISCLQFSQNGLYLASGSWDKDVFIWDLRTLDTPKVLDGEGEGHISAVTSLCWLPNIEFLLASASADHAILIWNSDTGDVMARYVFILKLQKQYSLQCPCSVCINYMFVTVTQSHY